MYFKIVHSKSLLWSNAYEIYTRRILRHTLHPRFLLQSNLVSSRVLLRLMTVAASLPGTSYRNTYECGSPTDCTITGQWRTASSAVERGLWRSSDGYHTRTGAIPTNVPSITSWQLNGHTKASRTIALQDARSSSTPTVRIITGRSQFHHLTPNGNVYLENYTSQYMHTAHIFNGKERFKNLFSPCTQARKYKLFPAP